MSVRLILDYVKIDDIYSDGDVENDILKIFKSDNPDVKIRKILEKDPSWPMRYHLSPIRENLLNWYEFPKEATLLEIGAGCGAVTGVFTRKLSRVVAVELSRRRAEVVAERHRDKENLTVYAGNLNDINLEEKFDYVTLIGVLEYAGRYTHTDNPFVDFLKNIKKYLKDGGTIFIAIENKFGLKYWSGVREDHTGKFFDSIQGYPEYDGIRTFGKKEIEDILKEVGFGRIDFYYPLPDYKLPIEIFSDKYLPSAKHEISRSVFPSVDYAQQRDYLFDEHLAMNEIVKNEKFDFFANSFLIVASL